VVTSVSFSPDGRLLATGSADMTAIVTDLNSGVIVRTIKHGDLVLSLSFSPDGQ